MAVLDRTLGKKGRGFDMVHAPKSPPDGTSVTMVLTVERVRTVDEFMALREEWQALEIESGSTIPFVTFEWALTWWQTLRQDKLSVVDTLDIRIVRSPDGKLIAVAPMMLTLRPARGPVQFRELQFFGADPNITELRGMLCVPEHGPAAYRALWQHIQACSSEWDWALLSGIPADETYHSLTQEVSEQASSHRDLPDFVLPLPKTWQELRSGMRRNIKESLRKCYNSLERDGLSFELEVARTRAQAKVALDHFFRLHQARADLTGTVNHPNVFASEPSQRFLRAVCDRLASKGTLRIFMLKIDGKVSAVRLGFAEGRSLYLYFSGFDPALGKYSIMTTTTAEAIKYAIQEGCESVNLSPGVDVSKTRWSPREFVSRELCLVSKSLRGRAMHALYQRGRKTIDSHPALAPLRRLVKRTSAMAVTTAGPVLSAANEALAFEGAA